MSELYAYALTAHVRYHTQNELLMDHLRGDGQGGDVLDVLDEVVNLGTEYPPPPEDGEKDARSFVVTVQEVAEPDNDSRVRYGRVKVDRRAFRHDVERPDGEVVEIEDDDLEGRPLFFWFVAPTDGTTALLLTEKMGRFGIYTAFWEAILLGALRAQFPDATFDFAYFAPEPVWQQYQEMGQGIEGAMIRRVLYEKDETAELDNISKRRRVGTIETRIDHSTAPWRDRVAELIKKSDGEGAVELLLSDMGQPQGTVDVGDQDIVKLRIKLGDKTRTVQIGRDKVPPLGYPVEGIPLDETRYPDVTAMATFAEEVAREIGGSIGIE